MDKTKQEKGKAKQFRWPLGMSHSLLRILAEEALKPNKPSSTFGSESLSRAAKEISETYKVDCTATHVENHLKTIRKDWLIISKLKDKSGFGWDDTLKMITASKNVYDEYIEAHPKHEKYLNKKIEMYEEMNIVVGKDMATGYFAKSYADICLVDEVEVDSNPLDFDAETEVVSGKRESSSLNPLSQKNSGRKRSRKSEDEFGVSNSIRNDLKEIASAIRDLTKNQLDYKSLHDQVMTIKGFSEDELDSVYEHLMHNEVMAKTFMQKSKELKKKWVHKFLGQIDGIAFVL